MYFNIFSLPVVAAGLIMLTLAIMAMKYNSIPGIRYFSMVMVAGAVYSLFYFLEISTDHLPLVITFYKLEYLGIPFIPAFYLLFALGYTGKKTKLKPSVKLAVFAIPATTVLIVLSNNYHGLFISEGQITEQGVFPAFTFKTGIWYWVHQAYAIITIVFSFVLFLLMWFNSAPAFRKQVATILTASLLPFLIYIFYLTGSFPWGLDPIPFAFAFTGLIIFLGLTRFNLFKLAPLARNLLFEKIPNPVIVFDDGLRIIDCNHAATELLSINRKQLGQAAAAVLHNHPGIISLLDQPNGTDEPKLTTLIVKNATLIYYSFCTPLLDDSNKIRGKMLILSDVTLQQNAEMKRRETEEKFRLIFENAPIGIFYYDKNGIIRACNDVMVKILGSSHDKLIGLNCLNLPDKRVADALTDSLSGKTGMFEGAYHSITGNKKSILKAQFKPVFTQGGELQGGFGIVEDVTEQKKSEDRIRRKNEELQQLNAEKDRFFSIIAHDLRSPFTAFLGYTELMIEETDNLSNEELRDFAVQIRKSALSLFTLLENLLEWARLKQYSIDMAQEQLFLRKIVMNCLITLEEIAHNKQISLRNNISDTMHVYADEKMISSVLRNLVSNAIKFTPRNGNVVIDANDTGIGMIEIKISDNGVGIDKNNMPKLFRIDQKINTPGTEEEPSTGLGLIICQEFVTKQGGKIWVESELGKGSDFYFTIPLSKEFFLSNTVAENDKI